MGDTKVTIQVGEEEAKTGWFAKLFFLIKIVGGIGLALILFLAYQTNIKSCRDKGLSVDECYEDMRK